MYLEAQYPMIPYFCYHYYRVAQLNLDRYFKAFLRLMYRSKGRVVRQWNGSMYIRFKNHLVITEY